LFARDAPYPQGDYCEMFFVIPVTTIVNELFSDGSIASGLAAEKLCR
jgi:hypothetical protein